MAAFGWKGLKEGLKEGESSEEASGGSKSRWFEDCRETGVTREDVRRVELVSVGL